MHIDYMQERIREAEEKEWLMRERALRAEAINRDLRERVKEDEAIARRQIARIASLSSAVRKSEDEIKCLKGALGDIAAAKNKVSHLKAEAEFLEDEIAFTRGG